MTQDFTEKHYTYWNYKILIGNYLLIKSNKLYQAKFASRSSKCNQT